MLKKIINFLERLVNNKYISIWFILILDTIFSMLGTLFALLFTARFINHVTFFIGGNMILFSMIISLIVFYILCIPRIIIRYTTFRSIGKIMLAVIIKVLLLSIPLYYLSYSSYNFVNLVVEGLIDGIFTFTLLILMRLFLIIFYDTVLLKAGTNKTRIVIYGIGAESRSLKVALHTSKYYQAVGFITYGPYLKSYQLSDLPILYFENEEDLKKVVKKYNINAILFVDDNQAKIEGDRLVSFCEKSGVKLLIAPNVDFEKGITKKALMRDISIEDLLGRDEIKINLEKIKSNFSNKIVLVTGAAGSIGSELCRQLATFDIKQLILFDNAETPLHLIRLELENKFPDLKFVPFIGDIRNINRLKNLFAKFHPQVVFHAAAYKHVPLMEENPCEAISVNVGGTRKLADLSIENGVEKLIMISTDKAVNPSNVMGASKRMAEMYVQSLGLSIKKGEIKGNTKFVTTRFGNVLGSNGSVIPYFRQQIKSGGPVTVTHPEIRRFFMTIPEACRLVMEAATLGKGNDIFVFDMGKPVKIVDLAKRMIRLAGYIPDEDIKIEFTGLRPGEKLYEEVLSNTENTTATENAKIRRAKIRPCDLESLRPKLEKIVSLAFDVKVDDTVKMMKEIVPEYKSMNSVFEKFDK